MRAAVFAILGLGVAGTVHAQAAHNTPEGIVCAMTGSCADPDPSAARVPLGKEKAFSLARPSTPMAGAAPTAGHSSAPRTVSISPARAAHRVATPAKTRSDGGIDMQVTFDRGSARLSPQAQVEARAFAKAMAAPAMAGMQFAIEGHTDSRGARDRNVALSQQRAQAVVDYLVSQGVDPSRLIAKGYGPDRPLAGTAASAPANRRVEFVKQA